MSIKSFTLSLLALVATMPTLAQTTTNEESGYVPKGYQLDWSDEFDGTSISSDWKFEVQRAGWVNHELQRYVPGAFPTEDPVASVTDGRLKIKCYKYNNQIISARMYARPSIGWRYCYIEARIKLPKGKGTWPAFWMMPVNFTSWPADGEIDIMEEVGYHPNYVSSSLHATAHVHSNNTQVTHEMYCAGAEDDYHIYAMEWTADKITTYVDGKVQLTYANRGLGRDDWPYDAPFYPILNLAWGGDWGGAQGVDESALPAEMLVDYVRIYKKPTPATAKKVIAYVTSWSSITPDANAMTHINYAFGGVGTDNKVFVEGQTRFENIVALKKKNPNLKVLLSVGGWGRGQFTPMSSSEANRKTFAKSCREFCDKYGIDGIDIDWEFPGNNSSGETSPSNEKQNYTLLMKDLREALGDDLLLTMASSSYAGYYDYKSCIQYLDFVNVMTYDMSGPPNHHSALYRGGVVSNNIYKVAHESIQEHLKAGIPADKLVMGLAFYGNSGAGSQISLQEIEDGIASGKWTDHWDDIAKVPYVTDASGNFAYGYDNARSLAIKCQYIIDNDLAGGMYWEYNNDNSVGTERYTVYDCLIGNATKRENLKFGDADLEYSSGNTYTAVLDLVQGRAYAATGAVEMTSDSWYYDPDFFIKNADGTYTLRAVTGKYQIVANFNEGCFKVTPLDENGERMTYDSETGTGCIWVIGNDGMGKPTTAQAGNWGASNGWNPTPDMFFAMPQVGDHLFQFTLTVGEQLSASSVNFKFFHQAGYGNNSTDEFNNTGTCRITTDSDIFRIDTSENGNIKLASGKSIKEGTTYVFTLDCSDPKNAKLTVTDAASTGIKGVANDRLSNKSAALYDLQGRRVDSWSSLKKGIYISNGKKVVLK